LVLSSELLHVVAVDISNYQAGTRSKNKKNKKGRPLLTNSGVKSYKIVMTIIPKAE